MGIRLRPYQPATPVTAIWHPSRSASAGPRRRPGLGAERHERVEHAIGRKTGNARPRLQHALGHHSADKIRRSCPRSRPRSGAPVPVPFREDAPGTGYWIGEKSQPGAIGACRPRTAGNRIMRSRSASFHLPPIEHAPLDLVRARSTRMSALKLPSPNPSSPLRWMNSKEDRPDHGLGEDLQTISASSPPSTTPSAVDSGCRVSSSAPAVPRGPCNALVAHHVIGLGRRRHELDPVGGDLVDSWAVNIVGGDRACD